MTAQNQTELKTAFELFVPSVNLIKKYLGVFFVLIVVPSLLISIDPTDQALFSPFSVVGGILAILFLAPSTYAETRAAGGHDITLDESFKKGLPYFWRLLGLSILVVIIIVAGLILFIIPGIIFARRYLLSPYYLIDRKLSITEAMRHSANETKPVSMSIYGIMAVYLLIGMLGIFGVFGVIASAILSVLYSLALPLRYFEIKKLKQ